MSDLTIGVIVAFMASVCWAVGSVLIRLGIDKVSPPSATFFSILSGFIFVAAIALIIDAGAFLEISASTIAGFALVGLLSFMGGRLFYYTSVSLIGVGRATAMGGATPIIAAVLAVFFLDEQLTIPLAIGIMAVVVGVGLIVTGPAQKS